MNAPIEALQGLANAAAEAAATTSTSPPRYELVLLQRNNIMRSCQVLVQSEKAQESRANPKKRIPSCCRKGIDKCICRSSISSLFTLLTLQGLVADAEARELFTM